MNELERRSVLKTEKTAYDKLKKANDDLRAKINEEFVNKNNEKLQEIKRLVDDLIAKDDSKNIANLREYESQIVELKQKFTDFAAKNPSVKPDAAKFESQSNAILRTMGIDPKPYDSYAFHTYKDFYGSSANNNPNFRARHKPDTLEVLIPTTPVKGYRILWDRSDQEAPMIKDGSHTYLAFLGGTQGPWRRFETGVDAGRSCLVIGDSFANAFLPFLVPYYETIHATDVRADYYDRQNAKWTISQYIQENGVDDVYFILSTANGVNTVYLIETLLAYL